MLFSIFRLMVVIVEQFIHRDLPGYLATGGANKPMEGKRWESTLLWTPAMLMRNNERMPKEIYATKRKEWKARSIFKGNLNSIAFFFDPPMVRSNLDRLS
jgi:hypothetical protein